MKAFVIVIIPPYILPVQEKAYLSHSIILSLMILPVSSCYNQASLLISFCDSFILSLISCLYRGCFETFCDSFILSLISCLYRGCYQIFYNSFIHSLIAVACTGAAIESFCDQFHSLPYILPEQGLLLKAFVIRFILSLISCLYRSCY